MARARQPLFWAAVAFCVNSIVVAQDAAAPLKWFKGNLHAHSLWSDGDDYPEMVAARYRDRGYNFLVLSEHNVLARGMRWKDVTEKAGQDRLAAYVQRFGEKWVQTRTEKGLLQARLQPLNEFRHLLERPGEFMMMEGEEITDRAEGRQIHYIATNLQDLIKPQGGKTAREAMDRNLAAVEEQAQRLGQPILAHHIHPNTGYAVTAEDLAAVVRERYFEVASGHGGVNQLGDKTHAGVERLWDIASTIRLGEMNQPPPRALAADDSHNFLGKNNSIGRAWMMVQARHLTPESIIKAIESGDFYATTGVILKEMKFSGESKTLDIEIDPQPGVHYTTLFIGTLKSYDKTREPVKDDAGKPLPVTQRYSNDIGKVLATAQGTKASYKLTGEELYVRAMVVASNPPEKPTYAGQKAQAWTQPVGWSINSK